MEENEVIKRFQKLMNVYKCSTMSAFAMRIGMNPSLFTRKMGGKTPITDNDFIKVYDSLGVNIEWMRNGTGEMVSKKKQEEIFVEENARVFKKILEKRREKKEGRKIPFYDVDFNLGFSEMYNDEPNVPSKYISVPGYEKADFWCRTSGDSMKPFINNGDIIALKEIPDWQSFLPMNEVYAIMTTNDLRTVKVVRRGSDDMHLTLHAYNDEYEDQEISKATITKVYKLLGALRTL